MHIVVFESEAEISSQTDDEHRFQHKMTSWGHSRSSILA